MRKTVAFNLIFWLLYFLYEWLGNASVGNEYQRYFINAIVIVPITCAASVFSVHVLIQKFYLKNKNLVNKKRVFWTGLILSMFLFTMIRRSFNYYYTYPHYWPGAN